MARLVGRVEGVAWCFVDNTPNAADAGRLREWVGSSQPVRFVELPNPGFAAACNRAVESSNAPWVMLLNPDVLIDEQQLRAIVSRAHELSPDKTLAVSMTTHGTTHAGIALAPGWWFVDATPRYWSQLMGPSGGAGLYARERFLEVGGFLESLFAWGEDVDLAWRLTRRGVGCEVLDLRLPHQGGHSHAGSREALQRKVSMLYRNRTLVAKRNLSRPKFVAFCMVYAAFVLVSAPRNARRHALRASLLGYLAGVRQSRNLSQI